MDHIAIDLGGRESQICVRNSTGEVLEERRIRTESLGKFFRERTAGRVVVETCAESFHIADQALAAGHEVRVVPATLVRTLGVGSRGVKTDRRDAQVLSEVSTRIDLPSVHIPSGRSRELKALCTSRYALVRARTLLSNSVRGWNRTQGRLICARANTGFSEKLRESDAGLPPHIERSLSVIDELNEQISAADTQLETVAKSDPVCQRLMSVPGVGVVTALWFVSAMDECGRFDNSHKVASYFGLVPGENSSSERKSRTGLTKAGNAQVRWTLVQAAWSAWRCRPTDPMVQWAKRVAERRGRKVAISALARKIAGILYALWRDQSSYNPCRGAERIDSDGVVHSANVCKEN